MDPLSLAASVITVAALAGSIGSAISRLRTLSKGLPGRLHALSNEVADLEVVLTQVAALMTERAPLPNLSQVGPIPHLLSQARSKLEDISAIVDRLNATVSANPKLPLLAARAWHKEHATLQSLQDDIRTVKSSLNILLGASNSYLPAPLTVLTYR